MILKGLTSGAQATVDDIRLVTDEVGFVVGCIFIPDPSKAKQSKICNWK